MKTTTVSALRTQLVRYLNQTEPVMVTHKGRTKAILVPVDDQTAVELARPKPRTLMDLLRQADERISRTGGLSHEEFWRKVEQRYGREPRKSRTARRPKSSKTPTSAVVR